MMKIKIVILNSNISHRIVSEFLSFCYAFISIDVHIRYENNIDFRKEYNNIVCQRLFIIGIWRRWIGPRTQDWAEKVLDGLTMKVPFLFLSCFWASFFLVKAYRLSPSSIFAESVGIRYLTSLLLLIKMCGFLLSQL